MEDVPSRRVGEGAGSDVLTPGSGSGEDGRGSGADGTAGTVVAVPYPPTARQVPLCVTTGPLFAEDGPRIWVIPHTAAGFRPDPLANPTVNVHSEDTLQCRSAHRVREQGEF